MVKAFKLYPNPCKGILHFEEADAVNILSLDGALIRSVKAKCSSIDVSSLASAYYLIELQQNSRHSVHKFFKK